jgi:hypothetical protein
VSKTIKELSVKFHVSGTTIRRWAKKGYLGQFMPKQRPLRLSDMVVAPPINLKLVVLFLQMIVLKQNGEPIPDRLSGYLSYVEKNYMRSYFFNNGFIENDNIEDLFDAALSQHARLFLQDASKVKCNFETLDGAVSFLSRHVGEIVREAIK